MTTLVDIIRTKTAATTDDASDQQVIAALGENSIPIYALPVTWQGRRGRLRIGAYRVEATGATGSVAPLELADAIGEDSSTCAVDQLGFVTIDDDEAPIPALYADGFAYDVHGAAADIVEGILAEVARKFDFTRGDQQFSVSQQRDGLLLLHKALNAKRIPRRRGEVVMRDQARTRWR